MLLVRYISVPNGRPGPVPLRALWDKIDDKAAATIHYSLGRARRDAAGILKEYYGSKKRRKKVFFSVLFSSISLFYCLVLISNFGSILIKSEQ